MNLRSSLPFRLRGFIASLLTFAAAHAQTVTIGVAAGKLYGSTGTALPAGNLVLLLADTSGNGFASFDAGSALSVGSYLNADDQILGRLFTDADGIASAQFSSIPLASNPTPGAFTSLTTGDALAVVWFSTLTGASSLLGADSEYGIFSNGISPTDGDPWTVPGFGQLINIHFLTLAADVAGTHLETAARASLTVTAVPEPATSAALAGVLAFALVAWRRQRAHS